MTTNADNHYQGSLSKSLIQVIADDVSLARDANGRVVQMWLQASCFSAAQTDELWRNLANRVASLIAFRRLVLSDPLESAPGTLLEMWLHHVDETVVWWERYFTGEGHFTETSDSSAVISRSQAVLGATVSNALVEWTKTQTLPVSVREALDSYATATGGWCEQIPVPPCRLRPGDVRLYLHRSFGLTEILVPLIQQLESWDDFALEDVSDEYVQRAKDAGNPHVKFPAARFSITRDSLLRSCGDLQKGWPYEMAALSSEVCVLISTLPQEDAPFIKAFQKLSAALDALNVAIENYRDRTSMSDSGSTIPSASLPLATNHDWRSSLSEISVWVDQAVDQPRVEIQSAIRHALESLIKVAQASSAVEPDAKIGRDLLSLLIDIDASMTEPLGPLQGLVNLREQLKRVLVHFFPYKVLDASMLLGHRFDEIRDWVRVRFSRQGGDGGRIVHVQRPGYLYQFPDGRSTVIRPAEVDISL